MIRFSDLLDAKVFINGLEGIGPGIWGAVLVGLLIIDFLIPKDAEKFKGRMKIFKRHFGTKYGEDDKKC